MNISLFPSAAVVILLTVAPTGSVPVNSGDIQRYTVSKEHHFVQTSAAAPVEDSSVPWRFDAQVQPTFGADAGSSSVQNPTVTLPNASNLPLPYDIDSNNWRYRQTFSDQGSMDAAFANGSYALTMPTVTAPSTTFHVTLSVSGNAYPNTPALTNTAWSNGNLVVDWRQSYTLTWNRFAGAIPNALVSVNIDGLPEQQLPASATSFTISAGSLPSGQQINANVTFINPTSSDTSSVPGALGASGYTVRDSFIIQTTPQASDPWTFDPTFERIPLRVTSESATGVKVLSSGKVLIYTINGGLMSGANGQRIGALVRVDPTTGAIDPTWHPDPTLTGSGFLGVAEAPDGKIYYSTALIGDLANPSDPAINRLIRLNTDGTRDMSFNSPIFAFVARFLGVQPDGKVIVCSGGVNLTGVPPPDSIVQTVRLNTDGTLDTTFQSPNFQRNANDPPASVASGNYFDAGVFGNPVIDSTTGKIYFCGFFRFVNGQARKAIVRCNADGTLDSSFVPTGLIGGTTQLTARAMVLQNGGKVVLGGTSLRTAAGGNTRYALLRFNTDGTLDPTFTLVPTTNSSGVQLVPGYSGPRDIHALADGKILTSDTRVIRFLPDGALDSTFTPLDYSSPSPFSALVGVGAFRFDVDANTGAAYLANPGPLYARLGGMPVPGFITKLTPGGTIDTQFNSPVVESEDFAPDVQIAASGAVYVSGYHTAFGNAANATITRLLANGTRDAAYLLDTLPFADKQAAGFALLPDNAAYVIYFSGAFNGWRFNNLVRLLPTGAIDTSFRPSSALQTAFSINAFDGNDISKSSLAEISAAPMGRAYLFPTGSQATVNANGNLKLTRVNADGTEDTSVPALGFPLGEVTRDASGITGGSTGYLHRLAQTSDGGFVVLASVAPFPTSTGAPYNYRILKLQADGSPDPNFNSPSITSTGAALLDFPALFDPVTGTTQQPPNGFYIEGQLPVSTAATFPDGSILLSGNFIINNDSTIRSLAKLTPTGALDTSFNLPTPGAENFLRPSRPAVVTNARVAPDGKIWVLGRFDTFGGNPAPGVARLNPDGTLDPTFGLTEVGYYDSFGDLADVVFADNNTAYLIGTFRRPGEPFPFAITRIVNTPVITSSNNATATPGQAFTYQVTSANNATSFTATGLPPGLTIDPNTGLISGTPTVAGRFTITLSATNARGTTTTTLVLTLAPTGAPPTITSPLTATGTVGQQFTYQVLTSAPAAIAVSNLPPGLTFDPMLAAIVGAPSQTGTFNVGLSPSNANGTTNATLVLTIQPPPPSGPIITSSTSATGRTGARFTFQVFTTNATSAARISATGLPPGLTIDPVTGLISGTPTMDGSFDVMLTVTDGTSTTTSILQLTFTSDPALPVITSPSTASVTLGQPFFYQIVAPATTDPGDITIFSLQGTLPNGLTFNAATGTITGVYTGGAQGKGKGGIDLSGGIITNVQLFATNSHGTTTIPLVFFLTPTGVANISTRLAVGTGENVLIAGFYITGNAPKKVVIRALGPSIKINGVPVPGTLPDPTLELHAGGGALIGANDDWRSFQEQEIIDTTVPPENDHEAAIVAVLNPGPYTAIVGGKNGATGIAIVEVYDLGTASLDTSSNSKLANLSTRGFVQTVDNVMIGGFIVVGGNANVILRAIGSELTAQGVAGALQDPTLDLYNSDGTLMASNDNWRTTQEQEIIATTVPPTDDREAAMVAHLPPGAYTAVVRGKNGTTGVGLVELYHLP